MSERALSDAQVLEGLRRAPDEATRAGLRECWGGEPAAWARHGPQRLGVSSGLHATDDRFRCTCTASGARCVLTMTAEDCAAPPAGRPAMDEPSDPRAVGLDDRGHALVLVPKLQLQDWVVWPEAAGALVAIDPDLTKSRRPARWLLLLTARGYWYDRAPLRTPVAVCTHDPRCGPTEKEVTPCT